MTELTTISRAPSARYLLAIDVFPGNVLEWMETVEAARVSTTLIIDPTESNPLHRQTFIKRKFFFNSPSLDYPRMSRDNAEKAKTHRRGNVETQNTS